MGSESSRRRATSCLSWREPGSSCSRFPLATPISSPRFPAHHRDPFDRLLVAQATLEGIGLVSDDEALRRYDVEIVW